MGKKLSIEEFVNKSKIIHNNEYDYDLLTNSSIDNFLPIQTKFLY
jgi:hypothetical protein